MSRRFILAMLGMLTVSGCSTYSLEELRHTTPQGNAFQNALAKLYMDFAGEEEKDYDWQNSWYFADKGLRAIYGKDAPIEDVADWDIPEEVLPQFEKAHEDLTRILTPETIAMQPEIAAKAQFYYECWLEQQEEGWQKDEIEFCKYEYLKALSKLDPDGKPQPKPVKRKAKKHSKHMLKDAPKNLATEAPKEAPKEIPAEVSKIFAPTTSSFALFFGAGESTLSTTANSTLNDIVKSVVVEDDYEVVVIDKSNDKKDALFSERFAAVKKRLMDGGVKETSIKTSAEAKAVDSKTINRKVEIFLND